MFDDTKIPSAADPEREEREKLKCIQEKITIEREVDWGLAANRLQYCAEELELMPYDLKSKRAQVQADALLTEAQDMIDEMSFLMDEIRKAREGA